MKHVTINYLFYFICKISIGSEYEFKVIKVKVYKTKSRYNIRWIINKLKIEYNREYKKNTILKHQKWNWDIIKLT